MPDAVVIGSGPNGLTAANLLADAGWEVLVLEAQPEPGGAVRSDHGVNPAFVSDVFSSFYPFAAVSPAFRDLGLEDFGLRWSHAPAVVAHPLADGRCATIHATAEETADVLARQFGAANGQAWLELYRLWESVGPRMLEMLFSPRPTVTALLKFASQLRSQGLTRTLRFLTLPARRLAEEEFAALGPKLLLVGCALHSDIPPDAAGSGLMGWMTAMLGQQTGWSVPAGGAGELTAALVRRLRSRGGEVRCDARVSEIVIRNGQARAVRTQDGTEHAAERAILADVAAPMLYSELLSADQLPARCRPVPRRFHWDPATFKVDWALSAPIPWSAEATAQAGAVHVTADLDELSDGAVQTATGRVPSDPFLIMGQMTTADPSRSPSGTQSSWAYTHIPHTITTDLGGEITGSWDTAETDAMTRRIEARIEQFAPGFRDAVVGRRVLTPVRLEQLNENLVDGAIGGGTANIHQQLLFRPYAGLAGARTPVPGLYLASASAHPGGGVHGVCGANAAHAALRDQGLLGRRVFAPARNIARRLIDEGPRHHSGRSGESTPPQKGCGPHGPLPTTDP